MNKQRSAFVTGATGFVGRHLVEQLVDEGWAVHALARPTADTSALPSALQLHAGDITDLASIELAMPDAPDAVFHIAADTSMWFRDADRQHAINVGGTKNMLAAAKSKAARRFLHTSSVAAYGFPHGILTEDSPRDTSGYWIGYYRSKAMAEQQVRSSELDHVVLNPGHIVGPYDTHNWARMIRMVAARKLPGIPPGSGSFADAREVAHAHRRAVDHGRSGSNYILGGGNHRFTEVIETIGRLLEQPVPSRVSPPWLLKSYAKVLEMVSRVTGRPPDLTPESVAIVCHEGPADSSRAIADLDYRITPLNVLFADTIEWMKKEGQL
ncbi:MAG: hypothetical protein DHS20C11_09710 [Lysobacteraceae bacterium]|nr:MAG: hypothetical protein DHS20C11_09710 [Xanthomonadaceae bacterium]